VTMSATAKPKFHVPWSVPDIGVDERRAVDAVLESGWLGMGPKTKEFESALSQYTGAKASVVVNNGTSALLAAYLANGIGPGTPVLVPTYTFVATVNALLALGARPILMDCDPRSLNVTPEIAEAAAQAHPEAKALVFVDVAGQACDIDAFRELAHRRGLALIEDAAEAFGATYRGKVLGGYDHTTIFSFHIAKQVSSIEGGAICSNNEELVARCRLIRSHGEGPQKYVHIAHGLNFRPTDLQSAVGIVQLRKVDHYLEVRRQAAERYVAALGGSLEFQTVAPYATRPTWMIFTAFARDSGERDAYNRWLNQEGIDTRIPWPPVHAQPFYESVHGPARFPGADRAFATVISLPIGNGLPPSAIEDVVTSSQEFFRHHGGRGAG